MMTVDELIDDLQRMPNRRVRIIARDYDPKRKDYVERELDSVSFEGGFVRLVFKS